MIYLPKGKDRVHIKRQLNVPSACHPFSHGLVLPGSFVTSPFMKGKALRLTEHISPEPHLQGFSETLTRDDWGCVTAPFVTG